MAGDEHLLDEEHDGRRELHHRHHGDDGELAAQAADAAARQRQAWATRTVAHPSGARIFSVASAAACP